MKHNVEIDITLPTLLSIYDRHFLKINYANDLVSILPVYGTLLDYFWLTKSRLRAFKGQNTLLLDCSRAVFILFSSLLFLLIFQYLPYFSFILRIRIFYFGRVIKSVLQGGVLHPCWRPYGNLYICKLPLFFSWLEYILYDINPCIFSCSYLIWTWQYQMRVKSEFAERPFNLTHIFETNNMFFFK